MSVPNIAQLLVQNFGSKHWERQIADSMEDFTELVRDTHFNCIASWNNYSEVLSNLN